MKENQNKTKGISIKYYIIITLIIFVLISLVTIWGYQSFLSDYLYRNNKIRETSKIAQQLSQKISQLSFDHSLDRDAFEDELESVLIEVNSCALVVNLDENDFGVNVSESKGFCPIRELSIFSVQVLHDTASQNGGEVVLYSPSGKLDINNLETKYQNEESQFYVYVKNILDKDNHHTALLISSLIRPITAESEMLNIQLIITFFIFSLLSLVVSLVLTRIIVRPINQINIQAKNLAKGDYSANYDENHGYKESIELAKTLNYSATELSKVDKIRNELIANVSHDLRTPLTMISGYGELIRDIPSENNKENIQLIIDEANRLARMVNNLLDLSKIQSGSLEMNLEEVSLNDLLNEIVNQYQHLMENEGFKFNYTYDKAVTITADKLWLGEAIRNLLNNAIQYSKDNKEIEIIQKCDNHNVKVSIVDHGIGVKKEDLANIWDRYYRIKEDHKRALVGSGLGLSIVKSIFERHNANYGADSIYEEGSTFWFEMPYKKDDS